MSEKLKPVKPPTTDAERKTWGRMAPPKYKDGLGKRVERLAVRPADDLEAVERKTPLRRFHGEAWGVLSKMNIALPRV